MMTAPRLHVYMYVITKTCENVTFTVQTRKHCQPRFEISGIPGNFIRRRFCPSFLWKTNMGWRRKSQKRALSEGVIISCHTGSKVVYTAMCYLTIENNTINFLWFKIIPLFGGVIPPSYCHNIYFV